MKKNLFFRLISRVADIKPGEIHMAFLLFSYFFLIIAPHTIIKTLRYTDLLVKWGNEGLPYGYFLSAVATGLVVLLYSKIQVKISKQVLNISSLVFFIVTGFLFQALLLLTEGSKPLSLIFWVWANVLTVVLLTHFGMTISEAFNPREAKRLIGFCGSGGILGGVIGGLIARSLTELNLGKWLLPTACGLLILCIFVVRGIFRLQKGAPNIQSSIKIEKTSPEVQKVGFKNSFNTVRKSRYLVLIASVVMITVIVSTFIDFQFSTSVQTDIRLEYAGLQDTIKNKMQSYFATFYAAVPVFAFFLQLLLTSTLLKKFGIRITLLLTPIVLLFGSSGMMLFPGLFAATLLKGSDEGLAFSLNQSTKEVLYIPFPSEMKNKVRPFIDMFVYRFAKALSAVFLLILFALFFRSKPGFSPIYDFQMAKYLSLALIPLVIIWTILNLKISKEYVSAVKRNIRLKWGRVDKAVTEKLDVDYTKLVFDTLESKERSSVLYALHLYDLLEQDKLTPEIKKLISQKSKEIKVSSLGDLFYVEGAAWFPDTEEKTDLDAFKTDIREVMSLGTYQQVMKLHAEKLIENSKNIDVNKMELAKAIGLMDRDSPLVDKLESLINDDSPEVARYAIESASRLKKEEHIPALISRLGVSANREDAVTALKKYGKTAILPLEKYIRDKRKKLEIRKAVVSVLAQIASHESVLAMVHELGKVDLELETEIIDALDRIHSEKPDIPIPQNIIKKRFFDLIEEYYETYIDLHRIKTGKKEPELKTSHQKKLGALFSDIFKLLGLYYPRDNIVKAYQNLMAEKKDSVAFAIELLDSSLKKDVRVIILPLIEDLSDNERVRRFLQILRHFPKA